jgi:hypothetical protein
MREYGRPVPSIRGAANRLLRRGHPRQFGNSASYWDERYRRRGNSGAGSYGKLAAFKAEVVNEVAAGRPVIEWGSGDGSQLAWFDVPSYIGVDVSPAAVEAWRLRYSSDQKRQFLTLEEAHNLRPRAPISLSLDVVYHLVEDAAFEGHMHDLFVSATDTVLIYSSNFEDNGQSAPHVRHRLFTDWVKRNAVQWALREHIPNRYPWDPQRPDTTSFSEFYIFNRTCQNR